MKNPIHKRIYRDILGHPGKTLPIFFALVFVVVFSSSFFTSQDSIKALYYEQLDKGKVEDGEFTTLYPLTESLQSRLEDENIKVYENFSHELSHLNEKKLRAFKNRRDVNLAQILEGRLARKSTEVAISGNYARANGIHVNDPIQLEGKSFRVVGLVSLPDYSSILRNRDDLVMDTGHYGTCLFDASGFDLFENLPVKYTYSYRTKDSLNKKEAGEKLSDIAEIVNKENFVIDGVTRFDNHCITYLIDDMGGDVPTMTTFMIILFVALAFISAVQVKSRIEEEAPVIGTLLASGYTKKELIRNYMAAPLLITLISAVIGNLISYSYAYKKYADLYYQSFDLPSFRPIFSLRSLFITSIFPLIIYLIINFMVISKSMKFTPLDFLRGNLQKEKNKSKVKLEYFSFLNKFKIRMALDNKLNIAALLFGVFLADALLIFGLSTKPIFKTYAQNMRDTMKYNYTVFVRKEEKEIQAEKATLLNVELMDKEDKKVQMLGVDLGSAYALENIDQLKEDEVWVSQGFLQRFSYKIHDTFTIKEPFGQKKMTLKIKGVDKDNNLFQLVTKREHLNKIIDQQKDYFNAYLSDEKLNITKDNFVTQIDKHEMTKFMEHFLESFGVVFDMIFFMGLGFYLILTFISSSVILDKSKLNMSYLKIFGFHDYEIRKIYVDALFILVVAFQLLMIPLLDRMIQFLIRISMMKFDAYIIVDIPLSMYLKAIVCSIVLFIIIQIAQRIKISKLDMVKELKM